MSEKKDDTSFGDSTRQFLFEETPSGLFVPSEPPKPRTLLDTFRELPEDAQARIMADLHIAMKWRTIEQARRERGLNHCFAAVYVNNIAEEFAANGRDIEEYT